MASPIYTAQDAAYWFVPLARAVPAAALACVITFAGGHYTPELGLATFGGFAVVSGIIGAVLNLRMLERGALRTVFLIQAIVSAVAGIAALIGSGGGLPVLLVVVSGWAAITGFLELYAGLRSRRTLATGRDWTFVGAVTALLAIVALLIPPGYVQHYTGPDGEPRVINASVTMVGALAVYGAVIAVYLVIGAFSLKWGPASAARNGTAQ